MKWMWMRRSLAVATLALAAMMLSATPARADDGAATYGKKCASCHGKDGKGQTTMGKKLSIKDLTDAKVQAEFTDEEAVKKVTDGVNDKDTGKVRMPANKGKLTDDEIKGVVTEVRTLKAS